MTRIDNQDQLDALPIGSIVIDSDCDVMHKTWDPKTGGDHWSHMGTERPGSVWLPVLLVRVPGRDLVQEALVEHLSPLSVPETGASVDPVAIVRNAQADAWDAGHMAGASNVANVRLGVKVRNDNPYRDEAL